MKTRFPGFKEFLEGKEKIAVIGLGYVGLPLAVTLSKKFRVVGFDIDSARVRELKEGYDRTGEVEREKIISSAIEFTDRAERLRECRLIIVTVPTPIDRHKIPDLRPLKAATVTVGRNMTPGTTVVYESTVYRGDMCSNP